MYVCCSSVIRQKEIQIKTDQTRAQNYINRVQNSNAVYEILNNIENNAFINAEFI